MQQVHVLIKGDVIGVGFRSWISKHAKRLKVTGWVRNVTFEKKAVEAVFQGEKKQIEKIISLCKKGPLVSWVSSVDISREEAREKINFFQILPTKN